ncbi:NnrU family protein [Coralliovum pocilloporae]|uniref:NnrU family protein n=1 Tax=Coralliovum pocilloporae TaxID=3066369 RepID=UPI0033076374
MTMLIAGLVLFIAIHTLPIQTDRRAALQARLGANGYKALFSILSLAGLALIVIGYGEARLETDFLWDPPVWTRHLAALLMLVAFIMLAAAYVPAGKIKARLKHPMILAVKIWALAHLLANGTVADAILFGSFLVYAIVDRISLKRRDAATGTIAVSGPARNDLIAVIIGLVAYGVFSAKLHEILIGVPPFS